MALPNGGSHLIGYNGPPWGEVKSLWKTDMKTGAQVRVKNREIRKGGIFCGNHLNGY